MIRNTAIAFATIAVAATTSASGAKAQYFWPNYSFTSSTNCYWVRQQVVVGYDNHGKPVYRWKRVKVCS
ncbi:hypothetical protein E3C22_07375 [Jiella endophytica]|uniref:Uncharacterized protein n=1 Tax=Jiella endophytica TaxID=2558362 RepID=A0A4Y8RNG8_9HYPH|nr:hypothetical protein [Jiella endophytica]TFF25192.1 hypothetical protein E3C22_07375 [Jiella endophytica]